MKSVLFLALAGSAAAFAPSTQSRSNTLLKADLSSLPGSTAPVGPFDPLNLADSGSEETLAWFRASELKHGRVAMLATTGYLVQGAGIHFPGMLSSDVSFESLSAMKPLEAWDAVPDAGKAQILGTIFIAEMITESKPVHYTKGGPMPTMVFPAIDFSGVDAATLKRKQDSELNNGRLAMIAIMSFISAANIPGSVPALTNNPAF
uniref:Fucoxanthin chlorophyll a/c protein 12 n=1 Tax=Chaetoceros neogracilis TaxID=240364 RepID=A0A6J4B1C2_9STRA|nr:Chain 12, Fucoxanthin chlorophyll a/c-binding protein Lhcq3 [Chaetoceros gracilis]6L4U_12 Chain 12, Fucoxanthin chlorophyll a/c-binding protein Lhcq3 [Chaetoceros gracilis]BBO94018.1 fucoxanthin chlorophyll a/c protein 12 [Chaetoceros gracilis]